MPTKKKLPQKKQQDKKPKKSMPTKTTKKTPPKKTEKKSSRLSVLNAPPNKKINLINSIEKTIEGDKKELARLNAEKVALILADARVRQGLIDIGGENAIALIRNFTATLSDEDISKQLKLKISDVRATLNKLHNEGLVNYVREKDSETGWYSYSWSLNVDRLHKWSKNQNKFISTDGKLKAEYYFCPSCGEISICDFETALATQFKCSRCGRTMEFLDEKKLKDLFDKKK